MSLFVYVTERCKEDAIEHGVQDRVERERERVEKAQNIYFDHFPKNFYKKKFGNLRLIAKDHKVELGNETHAVLVFHALYPRSSNEYNSFLENPQVFFNHKLSNDISQEELKEFVEQNLGRNEKEHLSNHDKAFLDNLLMHRVEEFFIYESKEWVKDFSEEKFIFGKEVVDKLIEFDNKEPELKIETEHTVLLLKKFHNFLFLYRIFVKSENIYENEIQNHIEKLGNFSEKDAMRKSYRSYPFYMLADYEAWLEIEKNDIANLSLSPEEKDVLFSAFRWDLIDNNSGFPLFINGRAGSGKSTVLQYLYAHCLFAYSEHLLNTESNILPPVYLTYSEGLKDVAIKSVEEILNANHNFLQNNNGYSFDQLVNKGVKTFHQVLKRNLNGKKDRFNEEKYIDFKRFKTLWENKFKYEKQKQEWFNPEISWHIIRTFIQGYSFEDYLDPEDYRYIPKKERDVSNEVFNEIYNKVWENWYYPLLKDENYWDDQTLVRQILDNDLAKPEYAGVFCDEAQDFTKIELEYLFRINYFISKKIPEDYVKRIPFAFAGDPFQTLNPTGFRWESVRANYREKFVLALSPELKWGKNRIDINYNELSLNYRSALEIVKLSNSVQLLRKVFFKYDDIKPQESWDLTSSTPVFFLDIRNQRVREIIRKQEDLHFIVPDESSNRELEFVKNDEDLKELIEIYEEEKIADRVSSPIRAKGLEFPRVAILKFGDYIKDRLNLDNFATVDEAIEFFRNLKTEDNVLIQYFLNKLYVAITRPQTRLFIIDTEEGRRALWKFVTKWFLSRLAENKDAGEGWIFGTENDNIGIFEEGTAEVLDQGKVDIEELAEKYRRSGLDAKDSYWMKQAAMRYKKIDRMNDYYECLAFANKYDKNWEKAAKNFFECGKISDALDMLWDAKQYKLIDKFSDNFKRLSKNLVNVKLEVSKSVIKPQTIEHLIKLLEKLREHKDIIEKNIDSTFISALDDILESVDVKYATKKEIADIVSMINNVYDWFKFGETKIDSLKIGLLFYKLKDWQSALKYFDYSNYDGEEKKECEVQILIKKFIDDPDLLEEDELERIKVKFSQQKDYENLLEVLKRISKIDYNIIKSTYNELIDRGQKEKADKFNDRLIEIAEKTKNYRPVIDFYFELGNLSEAIKYLDKAKNSNIHEDIIRNIYFALKRGNTIYNKREKIAKLFNSYVNTILLEKKKERVEALLKSDFDRIEKGEFIEKLVKKFDIDLVKIFASAIIRLDINPQYFPTTLLILFRERFEERDWFKQEGFDLEKECILKDKVLQFIDLLEFYEQLMEDQSLDKILKLVITMRYILTHYRWHKWLEKKVDEKKKSDEGERGRPKSLEKANNLLKKNFNLDNVEKIENLDKLLYSWEETKEFVQEYLNGTEEQDTNKEDDIDNIKTSRKYQDSTFIFSGLTFYTKREDGEILIIHPEKGKINISFPRQRAESLYFKEVKVNEWKYYKELGLGVKFIKNGVMIKVVKPGVIFTFLF